MVSSTVTVTAALCVIAATLVAASTPWSQLDSVLQDEIAKHSFPGCSALVVTKDGTVYRAAHGNFTYGIPPPESGGRNPPVLPTTRFDMASLTKVVATTTACMQLYQQGILSLHDKVAAEHLLGPAFAVNGKEDILLENLLLHNAGFPPDPVPNYWDKAFQCPETEREHPRENFSCQRKIFGSLLNQTLRSPPGQVYVYSDLSMITMMYVVGRLVRDHKLVGESQLNQACMSNITAADAESYQCFYEAYVREHVLKRLSMSRSGFLPDESEWGAIPPAWNDTAAFSPDGSYRNQLIQGQVSDGNSYALGGIAGHAGLFSTIDDAASLAKSLLFASDDDPHVNKTTAKLFTTMVNVTQSSRALGWDTNNYEMNSYRGCGNLSSVTFTHTGYTGTEICADPERQLITVLLTNRVYPRANEDSEERIHAARQRFNNAVKAIFDKEADMPEPGQPL